MIRTLAAASAQISSVRVSLVLMKVLTFAVSVVVLVCVAGLRPAAAQAAQPEQPRIYVAVGVGPGALTSTSTERFSNAVAISGTIGSRLTNCLHLVVGADMMYMARSSDPSHSLSATSVAVGLRWTPIPTLHLRAMAGIAIVETQLYGSVIDFDADGDAGLAAGAALAWLPMQRRDYSAGFEVGDQLIFNNGELRQGIGAMLLVQLSMPTGRRRASPPPAAPVVAASGSSSR